ncbi:MAG: flagellar M-ring protein FliF [bacterium]|nr:flagellar M-ring protein FliF [bacterium]
MAEEKSSFIPLPLRKILDRFTPSQKIFIVSVIVLTVVGIFLVTNLASNFTYGVLFTNLSQKDSGMILEQLKAKKVPYEISGSGSVISVPEGRVSELRIELAAAGLPEGSGVGFEIFDKASLSTTDFVQNINYVRAVEGELGRTISQLREVNSAKVHITMPKRSVFIEEQEPAKASIVLKLRPGAHISGNIIPAILHLTAQSVEGLTPDNIAVVDIYGSLLSKPRGDGDNAFDDKQLAYRKKMEKSISRDILSILEPIVGAGRVRANVKLTLDFDKVETTEEVVDPDQIAKVSEKSETKSSSGGSVAGGIPGVSSNVAQATGGATTNVTTTPAKSKAENSLINYEVSKKVTHIVKPIGEIKHISAAVVVDDGTEVEMVDGEILIVGGKPKKRPVKRTPEQLTALKQLVRASIGFNSARGDIVEVVNLPFDTSVATESEYYQEKQDKRQLYEKLGWTGLYALIAIMAYLIVVRPVFRKMSEIMKNLGKPKIEEIEIPRVDSDKMAALQSAKDEAEIEKELLEQYKVPKSSKKMGIIKQKVMEFAEDNIDGTTSLVKSFLMEES